MVLAALARLLPPRPALRHKASRVLDLYARTWHGQPVGDGDFVISADEKTSIQARCRCHPTLPPGRSWLMRVEHEYERGGAIAYLAALDVHRGTVFGRCEASTGIAPFARLVEQVMTREPYATARRVFWIVDNGSSHRGQASIDRISEAWPTARLVHLPVHASWLNQIETWFGIITKQAIRRGTFTSVNALIRRIRTYVEHWNTDAKPFVWTATADEILAKVRWVEANVKQLVANNSK